MYIPVYESNAPEQEYALRLINEDDRTKLCIVDKKTGVPIPNGRLAFFNSRGELTLYYGVDRRLALALGIAIHIDKNQIVVDA